MASRTAFAFARAATVVRSDAMALGFLRTGRRSILSTRALGTAAMPSVAAGPSRLLTRHRVSPVAACGQAQPRTRQLHSGGAAAGSDKGRSHIKAPWDRKLHGRKRGGIAPPDPATHNALRPALGTADAFDVEGRELTDDPAADGPGPRYMDHGFVYPRMPEEEPVEMTAEEIRELEGVGEGATPAPSSGDDDDEAGEDEDEYEEVYMVLEKSNLREIHARLQKRLESGGAVSVSHLHHMLRRAEVAKDLEFVEDALKLFRHALIDTSPVTVALFLDACGRANSLETAVRVFEGRAEHGLFPAAAQYNKVMLMLLQQASVVQLRTAGANNDDDLGLNGDGDGDDGDDGDDDASAVAAADGSTDQRRCAWLAMRAFEAMRRDDNVRPSIESYRLATRAALLDGRREAWDCALQWVALRDEQHYTAVEAARQAEEHAEKAEAAAGMATSGNATRGRAAPAEPESGYPAMPLAVNVYQVLVEGCLRHGLLGEARTFRAEMAHCFGVARKETRVSLDALLRLELAEGRRSDLVVALETKLADIEVSTDLLLQVLDAVKGDKELFARATSVLRTYAHASAQLRDRLGESDPQGE